MRAEHHPDHIPSCKNYSKQVKIPPWSNNSVQIRTCSYSSNLSQLLFGGGHIPEKLS